MKIYVGHSREFDYEAELYQVIRQDAELAKYDFILPHEAGKNFAFGREFYNSIDLFIAEVSFPATGLGIELGWVYDADTPIVCISKKDAKVSSSLRAVTDKFYQYDSAEELAEVIKGIVKAQLENS